MSKQSYRGTNCTETHKKPIKKQNVSNTKDLDLESEDQYYL